MKVAIVHDYLKEYGGAEKVLENLIEVFPNAEIFTLVYFPSFLGPHKKRFEKLKVHTSFLQNVPFAYKLISPFRLVAPFAFKRFDFSKFDVIIVSQTGAYIPNSINKKNAVQICYSHTPPRYLYGFATARNWKKNVVMRAVGEVVNHLLRIADYKASQNVDCFISNSENVRGRIEKFYRRDAKVIYPPVSVPKVKAPKAGDYYLTGGRLARPKHTDLIVEAFAKLDKELKVFGKGFAGYGEELVELSGEKTQFLGEVKDEDKFKLMRNAKAFIFASEDEDFGITPVEAMALGTPVIAFRSGGALETVKEGKTGIFFDELTVESLPEALKKFETMTWKREDIIKNSKKFEASNFKKEIKEFVNSKVRGK